MELERLSQVLGERTIVSREDPETRRVVKSASRVLEILELFDVLQREALVCEVSSVLDLPQSSTSVLLRSLVTMGYLSHNPKTRAFSPTTRVALLGNWVNEPMLSDGPLQRLMQSVNQRTGQSVVLAVRNQIWSQYIHVLQATSPVRMFVVKGSRRPLVCSGTGLTLLTDLPDSEIKRIAVRHNAEAGEGRAKVTLSGMLEEVENTRRTGYAFSHDRVTTGGGCVAMALPRMATEEHFSIGIAGSTEILRRSLDEYVAILREEIAVHFLPGSNVARITRPDLATSEEAGLVAYG